MKIIQNFSGSSGNIRIPENYYLRKIIGLNERFNIRHLVKKKFLKKNFDIYYRDLFFIVNTL